MTEKCSRQPAFRIPGWRAGLLALLIATVIGCAPRLNHFHSDSDQKRMDTSVDDFKSVTDDSTGVYAQRQTNLKAETGFRRGVGIKTIFNTDERGLNEIYGRTWSDMINDLGRRTGLPTQDEPDILEALRKRIPILRAKLGAIADTLNALGAGETAIQGELLQQAQAARNAMTALDPSAKAKKITADAGEPAQPGAFAAFLDAYQRYREALRKAGKDYTDLLLDQYGAEPALARATQLQIDLLKAAAASRDPESAYAIVAAVGTGLDSTSMELIESYRKSLESALVALKSDPAFDAAKKTVEQARSKSTPESQTSASATPPRSTARKKVLLNSALDPPAKASDVKPAMGEFFDAVDHAAEKTSRAGGGEASTLKFMLSGAPENTPNPTSSTPEFTADHILLLKRRSAERSDLFLRITSELQAVRSGKPSTFSEPTPRPRADSVPTKTSVAYSPPPCAPTFEEIRTARAPATTASSRQPTTPSTKEPAVTEIDFNKAKGSLVDGLVNSALINSGLSAAVDKKLNTEKVGDLVKQIDGIVGDIMNQALAHQERVAKYLADVLSVGVDLHGENKRHYDALSLVLARELERWELMASSVEILRADYKQRFDPEEWKKGCLPLFLEFSRPFEAPTISEGRRIFDSIHTLAFAAKKWQETSPLSGPPDRDRLTFAANVRSRRAIEALSSYLFVVSTNERFAVEDGIQLRSEIGEHDIALDKVEARTTEAKLRYDLGELQAYYQTGVTAQDIQTLLQFIQNALLGWIAGGVN